MALRLQSVVGPFGLQSVIRRFWLQLVIRHSGCSHLSAIRLSGFFPLFGSLASSPLIALWLLPPNWLYS